MTCFPFLLRHIILHISASMNIAFVSEVVPKTQSKSQFQWTADAGCEGFLADAAHDSACNGEA